ncbi:STAS domain-containing protein [Amycolatopsis sp. FDAARGOS 1241]|uniref:STAS domain-containing protein n=1 Tax=Amycolatopsis sp. FDAARGOS 1241 TaxID=2778070 RepID=UPI00195049FC|nr:STAS domain-containing protein [Amycolatopsis sp. FDAARGOS 1241]QRP43623.1 STAS domain-containing protein [Amycolatopsis sp. FDAARGOS 1241]
MNNPFSAVSVPADLTVTTTERRGVRVLTPVGDVDAATATGFTEALLEAAEAGAPLVADLSRVEFLSCAGIRALFAARERATSFTVVCDGVRSVRRCLEVTGADTLLTVHSTLSGALAAAAAS